MEIVKRGKNKFVLDKRYSEFNQLNTQLKKIFADLPNFPSKTIFDISKNPEELERRRMLLEKYINVK
jgi:PX domain